MNKKVTKQHILSQVQKDLIELDQTIKELKANRIDLIAKQVWLERELGLVPTFEAKQKSSKVKSMMAKKFRRPNEWKKKALKK